MATITVAGTCRTRRKGPFVQRGRALHRSLRRRWLEDASTSRQGGANDKTSMTDDGVHAPHLRCRDTSQKHSMTALLPGADAGGWRAVGHTLKKHPMLQSYQRTASWSSRYSALHHPDLATSTNTQATGAPQWSRSHICRSCTVLVSPGLQSS